MFRRLAIVLAVLAGLAVLADRGLAALAGNAAGRQVARSENLEEDPAVSFRGFPFLTQAVRGRFREIDVEARDVRVEGLTVTEVRAELRGVEVGLGDALSGEVEAVPVESGEATVTLSYADLNDYLAGRAGRLRVSPASGALRVSGSVTLPVVGTVEASGTGSLRVDGTRVVVTVSGVVAEGRSLTAAAQAAAASRLSFGFSLAGLPFGIELVSAGATGEGVVVRARARGIVVRVR